MPKPARVCSTQMFLVGLLLTSAGIAVGTGGANAQSPYPIEQVSQNTQPGWGKVYASTDEHGAELALFSNGDLAPGAPGNSDGSWEVFRWSTDGTVVQVTSSKNERPPSLVSGTSAPSISADGRRIAFTAIGDHVPGKNTDGSREIFLWEEGQGIRQITDSEVQTDQGSHHPWISGDGTRIIFASDMHGPKPGSGIYQDAQTDIYLWDESGGIRRITSVADPQHRAWMPRLSLDGQVAVFYSNAALVPGGNADAGPEVFLWHDGHEFAQLTSHVGGKSMGFWAAPSVSGDGTVVAFATDADLTPGSPGNHDGSTEVFTWTPAGGLRQLTDLEAGSSARSPWVSGDGRTVALVSTGNLTPGAPGNPDGGQELYLRGPDGRFHQLTQGASTGGIALPVLSYGSELVAFLSDRDLAVGNPVLTPQTFVIRLQEHMPTPTPRPSGEPHICPQIVNRVPAVVQTTALASPDKFHGWGTPLNPALPPSTANPLRVWLSLTDLGKHFSPANPVIWKAGCP